MIKARSDRCRSSAVSEMVLAIARATPSIICSSKRYRQTRDTDSPVLTVGADVSISDIHIGHQCDTTCVRGHEQPASDPPRSVRHFDALVAPLAVQPSNVDRHNGNDLATVLQTRQTCFIVF